MTTKIVTAYWMGVNGYPFQGSNDSRKSRYLGSLISHCLGIDFPIICYTHSRNLEELYQLKQEYNLSNLEIKTLELTDMRYHKEISKIRDNNFDGNLDGRGPEIMWGKFQVLEQEIKNSDYLYWIDVGIQHPGIFPWRYCKQYNRIDDHPVTGPWWAQYDSYNFSSLLNTKIFINLNKKSDSSISTITCTSPQISYPFYSNNIIDYTISALYPVGGMIGGNPQILQKYISLFWNYAEKILNKNILCTEEAIMKLAHDKMDSSELNCLTFDAWHSGDHDTFHFSLWNKESELPKPLYMIWNDILNY
jgi:hypothetical protein